MAYKIKKIISDLKHSNKVNKVSKILTTQLMVDVNILLVILG